MIESISTFPFRVQTQISDRDGRILDELAKRQQTNRSTVARQAIHKGLETLLDQHNSIHNKKTTNLSD